MDRPLVRRGFAAAFAFLLVCVSVVSAEVKLRIYLQDGSLQSGNLITETDNSFVILGKDGRVELQKKNIMFVNGKTLKQWNDRPDKLFQTEIMPSDVPDPSFVNNKAALPPVPKIPATPAVLAPVEPVRVPVAARPVPKAEPTVEAPKPEPRSHHKPKPRDVAAAPAPVGEPAKPAIVAAAPVEPSPRRPSSRKLADRAAKGALHRQNGFALLKKGDTGQAMQEFMIARILEPDNGDTNLALGRIQHDGANYEAALKTLGHWTLRKSSAAADEIATINREVETNARRLFYMEIAGGVGLFSWLPFVLIYRRIRRRRLASRPVEVEVEADVVAEPNDVASPVRAADWVKQAEARFTEAPAPVAPPPPPARLAPPPMMRPTPPPPLFVPEPVAPPAVGIGREEEIFAEEPPATPVDDVTAPPLPEPIMAKAPEPIIDEPILDEPEAAPFEEPQPAYHAAAASTDFDPSEILAMARSVENALVRANAAASSGRSDQARRGYRTALALNADCASAHLGLGYLAFMEEKWDTALLHYREALKIDPKSADAHYGAARVLLEINRVDDAVPELRATLTIDPTHDDARDALTAIGKPA